MMATKSRTRKRPAEELADKSGTPNGTAHPPADAAQSERSAAMVPEPPRHEARKPMKGAKGPFPDAVCDRLRSICVKRMNAQKAVADLSQKRVELEDEIKKAAGEDGGDIDVDHLKAQVYDVELALKLARSYLRTLGDQYDAVVSKADDGVLMDVEPDPEPPPGLFDTTPPIPREVTEARTRPAPKPPKPEAAPAPDRPDIAGRVGTAGPSPEWADLEWPGIFAGKAGPRAASIKSLMDLGLRTPAKLLNAMAEDVEAGRAPLHEIEDDKLKARLMLAIGEFHALKPDSNLTSLLRSIAKDATDEQLAQLKAFWPDGVAEIARLVRSGEVKRAGVEEPVGAGAES